MEEIKMTSKMTQKGMAVITALALITYSPCGLISPALASRVMVPATMGQVKVNVNPVTIGSVSSQLQQGTGLANTYLQVPALVTVPGSGPIIKEVSGSFNTAVDRAIVGTPHGISDRVENPAQTATGGIAPGIGNSQVAKIVDALPVGNGVDTESALENTELTLRQTYDAAGGYEAPVISALQRMIAGEIKVGAALRPYTASLNSTDEGGKEQGVGIDNGVKANMSQNPVSGGVGSRIVGFYQKARDTVLETIVPVLLTPAAALARHTDDFGNEIEHVEEAASMGIMGYIGYGALGIFGFATVLSTVLSSFFTTPQGHKTVTTLFGAVRKITGPGLHLKIPFFEQRYSDVSIQSRTYPVTVNAITRDKAVVEFTATAIVSVKGGREATDETIENVAFKFASPRDFVEALNRTVESSVRGFVSAKSQEEVIGINAELTHLVKQEVDAQIEEMGYDLNDIKITEPTFDEAITKSMARVVTAQNDLKAAEYRKQETIKQAEGAAESRKITITVEAEGEAAAAESRATAFSNARKIIATGMQNAFDQLGNVGTDRAFVLMITDMIMNGMENMVREAQPGTVIFMDSSPQGMENIMHKAMGLLQGGPLQKLVEGNQKLGDGTTGAGATSEGKSTNS
jgi:regulator of protease activity HflC (stomatin/prohibitin superfamily)